MTMMRAAAFVPGGGGLFVPESSPAPTDVANPVSDGTPDNRLTIIVYDHRADKVIQMDFEEYVYRVTASEMPAGREVEALKAQAVAARTYAVRRMQGGGCGRGGADVCTDSGHCQAYHDAETLRANWGDKAEEKEARVRGAVEATRGLIIEYQGQPINALFHASSGGHTEDEMPFDQHQLMALLAPRILYVASAVEDLWADPQSEFMAATLASESYEMLGLSGLVNPWKDYISVGQHLHDGHIGYHLRKGRHFLSRDDWQQYMAYFDEHFPYNK